MHIADTDTDTDTMQRWTNF